MHPFRFGLSSAGATSMSAWRERAREAESLGYSALYVTDHLDTQLGPLVAATVAAEATTVIRIGTLVLNNDLRNPVVLAKEIASLGLTAPERVDVGLGAGWLRSDYEETGIRYDVPSVRVERLVESLQIMKALWKDGEVTFAGDHYSVREGRCDPRPTSPPRLIVGGGSKRVLTVASEHADIVNVSLKSGEKVSDLASDVASDHFDRCLAWVRSGAGDRFGSLELQVAVSAVMVVGSRRAALRSVMMLGFPGDDALDLPLLLIGSEDEMCERLIERRERWGFSNIVISGDSMNVFAPVVARLAGS
jgi:probable F420-dependent oxidoreductase